MQAILCRLAAPHLDAQLEKLELDLLGRLGPGTVALASDDIVKSLESRGLLAYLQQLCSTKARTRVEMETLNAGSGDTAEWISCTQALKPNQHAKSIADVVVITCAI
jgi:hypothetical protein